MKGMVSGRSKGKLEGSWRKLAPPEMLPWHWTGKTGIQTLVREPNVCCLNKGVQICIETGAVPV